MKSLISILALVLSLGLANAQQGGNRPQRTPEEMAKMQMERLTKELNLSQTQQDSIQKYILSTSKEQQKIFREAGDNREAAMKSMQALREKQSLKVKTFLNEEQSKKYDELAKQRGFGAGGQRGQRPTN
ncbi:hypothetical protein [Sphingobacterium bovistauri]|uniref:DUF4890 domain-containing protein n=1 Tax=Sphingobacterium bovistauri TaxID=2781959 RepID=A0ABS7Z5G3_9SPHI|nr:hypothetical protein [Sphingobacterium bovistauri]MCA5005390.1 hypothetical protein [Sphingobacterium bovistauri]